MKRLSAVWALASILLILLAGTVLAADGTKQVGLVIAFPDGTKHAEIVTVPADATTFDALQKAKVELVSTTGQYGPAVCSINKVGGTASNCFSDPQHFWAFYHLDPQTNKWVSSQEGVGAAKPANGAVEGFVWSGADAQFNPTDQPPVMTFAQIQAQAGGASGAQGATAAATSQAAAGAKPAALPTTGGSYLIYGVILTAALLVAGAAMTRAGRSTRHNA